MHLCMKLEMRACNPLYHVYNLMYSKIYTLTQYHIKTTYVVKYTNFNYIYKFKITWAQMIFNHQFSSFLHSKLYIF